MEIAKGGPILAVQVENEYGSFGKDKVYMEAIRKMIVDAGFTGSLYTADGSGARSAHAGGTLDGVISVINFGDNANTGREFANFAKFRTGVPRANGEYWCGWFDHWGEKHHVTNAQKSAAGVEWMLSRGVSFNLYMVHGGSSWGYMSGANGGRQYEPDISAYDYDAPIDEAGRPTQKFAAIREVIRRRHLPAGEKIPGLPPQSPVTRSDFTVRVEARQKLDSTAQLPKPHKSDQPLLMEMIGQSYGFILYRTRLARAAKGTLEIAEARDFAVVSAIGSTLGTLDRRKKESKVEVDLPAGAVLRHPRREYGPHQLRTRAG